jgi:hypothetical protein
MAVLFVELAVGHGPCAKHSVDKSKINNTTNRAAATRDMISPHLRLIERVNSKTLLRTDDDVLRVHAPWVLIP